MAFLRGLFAPRGNLLTAEILAEVTLHLLTTGEAKTVISKFADGPEQRVSQGLIQALINGAISVARERHISINWPAVATLHPPYPEHAAALPPPPPVAPK